MAKSDLLKEAIADAKAVKETAMDMSKRPTKQLKDMGNVSSGIPSLGSLVSKFRK